jgi:predicted ATPase
MNIKFSIKNFRVFKEMSEFDIKPITIITGKNNSGKSSLLKALQVLINSTNNGVFKSLRLWENDLNLGSFETLVTDTNRNNIIFKINNLEISYYKCEHYPEELEFNYVKVFDENKNELCCLEGVGGIKDGGLYITLYVKEHLLRVSDNVDVKETARYLIEKEYRLYSDTIYYKVNPTIFDPLVDMRNRYFNQEYDWNKKESNYVSKNVAIEAFDILDSILTEQQIKIFCDEYEKSLLVLLDVSLESVYKLNKFYQTILLPSSRGLNKRIYSQQNSDNFLEKALFDFLKYRSANYKDGKFFMGSENFRIKVEDEKVNYLTKWLQEFGLGQFIEINHIPGAGLQAQVVNNGTKTHLADLGFGYSQLLPIILFSSYEHDYKNLIIEEPESHLHPNLQSKLAEMFVDAYQIYKTSFIIETHSEYLIRKLQYLVAKGKISKDDISIYYFDKTENNFEYRKIEMRSDGILKEDFGAGFFDESVTLTKELLTRLKNN